MNFLPVDGQIGIVVAGGHHRSTSTQPHHLRRGVYFLRLFRERRLYQAVSNETCAMIAGRHPQVHLDPAHHLEQTKTNALRRRVFELKKCFHADPNERSTWSSTASGSPVNSVCPELRSLRANDGHGFRKARFVLTVAL